MDTVPQSFRLGRQSIKQSTVQAAEVDKEETFKVSEQPEEEKTSSIPSSTITDNIHHSAMSQTMAALTLARTATTGSHFMGFSRKGKGPAFPPYISGGRGGPSGSGSGGPPGGGGGGGPPGGGGVFPLPGPGAGGGGGGGKLGGNPPRIFDSTCSEADTFMNEFSLYHLTNIGADQIDNTMKRAPLLLGFIQGENVKDWVKCWTNWTINQLNTGRPAMDEYFWTTIAGAFKQAFQDTGAMECTEEKLCHLSFQPRRSRYIYC